MTTRNVRRLLVGLGVIAMVAGSMVWYSLKASTASSSTGAAAVVRLHASDAAKSATLHAWRSASGGTTFLSVGGYEAIDSITGSTYTQILPDSNGEIIDHYPTEAQAWARATEFYGVSRAALAARFGQSREMGAMPAAVARAEAVSRHPSEPLVDRIGPEPHPDSGRAGSSVDGLPLVEAMTVSDVTRELSSHGLVLQYSRDPTDPARADRYLTVSEYPASDPYGKRNVAHVHGRPALLFVSGMRGYSPISDNHDLVLIGPGTVLVVSASWAVASAVEWKSITAHLTIG